MNEKTRSDQVNGCNMCKGDYPKTYYYYQDDGELVHIGVPHKNTPSIYIEIKTGESFHSESVEVNFCPNCGTSLKH